MREEFGICPKIVFVTFLVTFETEGGNLAQKGVKGGCSNVSVTKWKIPCFNLGKMDIFPHSVHWALPNIRNSDPLMNYCFKYFVASKRLKTFEN